MPIATTPEQRALQAALRDWAKRAGPVAVVRAQADPAPLLEDLDGLGVFAIPADGTVTDLAAALEELAAALAPGPVLPRLLAALLLAREPGRAGKARDLEPACVALTPGTLTGTREADGTLRVTGETTPLLWSAGHLLAPAVTPEGDTWFAVGTDAVTVTRLPALDFSRELATVCFDVRVPAGHVLGGLDTGHVRNLAATLYAAEAAGVAAWCTGTAAEYARTRRQFGRPIGEFQAVKHLCATMACRAERAAALAWDAARAADQSPAEHPPAAAAAAALALDDAVANAKDCIQVLGGVGFTWEHDAHLYLRRALALRQLLGGTPAWRAKAAELAAAGVRRPRGVRGDGSPRARGGLGGSSPRTSTAIGAWAGPAIEKYGTPEQKERFLGPTRDGAITWCQLFSEPEAGSDLASLRTKATRTDRGWRLTGQKVWTSLAREADWAICLARTDPHAPRHKGLTFFLVDMHTPGLDIRPLREITGRAVFNQVFLDDVAVPDDCVLGAPGDGWRIAMSTLAAERVAMGGEPGWPAVAENFYTERTGLHVSTAHAVALLEARPVHPAIRKLMATEHRQAVAETALEQYGPAGAADTGEAAGAIYEFLLSRCLSIAGGTTQILLNQVAERVLGLPRDSR